MEPATPAEMPLATSAPEVTDRYRLGKLVGAELALRSGRADCGDVCARAGTARSRAVAGRVGVELIGC
jgi:hypothetical protein